MPIDGGLVLAGPPNNIYTLQPLSHPIYTIQPHTIVLPWHNAQYSVCCRGHRKYCFSSEGEKSCADS